MWTSVHRTAVAYEKVFTNSTKIAELNLEQATELSCSCKLFGTKTQLRLVKPHGAESCGGTLGKGAWTNTGNTVDFFSWLSKENIILFWVKQEIFL